MHCFVHDGASAAGVCRNCGRGLCRECAAETSGGLACKGRCEEAVAATAEVVRRGVMAGAGNAPVQGVGAVLAFGFASYLTYTAISDLRAGYDLSSALTFGMLAGLLFLLAYAFGRAFFIVRKAAKAR